MRRYMVSVATSVVTAGAVYVVRGSAIEAFAVGTLAGYAAHAAMQPPAGQIAGSR